MIYVCGIVSIILGLFLINIISKVRDKNVSENVSNGELVELKMNQITEESLRAKYSSGWFNFLALLPLPLILGGIFFIFFNLWLIEILWVKIVMIYGLIGVLYAFFHIKKIDVGASGPGITFLTVSTLWPLVIILYVNKYIRNKRIGR